MSKNIFSRGLLFSFFQGYNSIFLLFLTIFDGFLYFYKKIVGSKALEFSLVNSKIMHRKQNQRFLRRLSFMH
jgi:hypothetical protein